MRTLTVECYENKGQLEIQNNSNINKKKALRQELQLNNWTRKTRNARTLLFRKRLKYVYASVYMCVISCVDP